jgi:S1-C subfamily serine protease
VKGKPDARRIAADVSRRQGETGARRWKAGAGGAALALVLLAGFGGPPVEAAPTGGGALNVGRVTAMVDPAVVDVNVTLAFGQGTAEGTGMIVTPSGEVLTNNHVVEGAGHISVRVEGHAKPYAARVLGVDPTADVALIQLIGATHLPTIHIGNAARVAVGEPVAAIGNALGLGGKPTVTLGTITGLNRTITASNDLSDNETLHGMLETDAALAPGDSGGPLVDAAGQVLGMDTAAYNGGSPVGFAIPIDRAMAIVHAIQAGRASSTILIGNRALLGVDVLTVAPDQVASGFPAGALVWAVFPGTPAASAGLMQGDVITGLNGHAVTSAAQLAALIHANRPGAVVTVTWVTPMDQEATATVTLATAPVQ